MEENLCSIELLKKGDTYVARVESQLGGKREFKGRTFEEMLEQIVVELQEEFEASASSSI